MIGQVEGKITDISHSSVIVMTYGVGYRIYIPTSYISKIHNQDAIRLFIHTHVKDDAIELFGFYSKEEQNLFELLLTVSGIGPKTSLLVIDKGVTSIQQAIIQNDVTFFTSIPRLGKKNAQKIIIELKNKISGTSPLNLHDLSNQDVDDLVDALQSMGFKKNEIFTAMKHLRAQDRTMEEKIKTMFKYLNKST